MPGDGKNSSSQAPSLGKLITTQEMGSSGSKQEETLPPAAPAVAPSATKTKPVRAVTQISEYDRTVLDLKNARDRLRRFRKKLDADTVRLQERARVLVSRKQDARALTLLKLRSFKTKEADKVEAKLFTVLNMIENVEWESQNIEVLKALKEGTEALNKMHDEMSLDTVEAILDESREAIELESSISTMLQGAFSLDEEDSLAQEYEALMVAIHGEIVPAVQLPAAPTAPVLPIAPAGIVPKKEKIAKAAVAA